MANNSPEIIVVSRLPIRLGQFLKLTDMVLEGGEATSLIANGQVEVNSMTERRRGRKLFVGDTIHVSNKIWRIAGAGVDTRAGA